jgi:DNA-binding transcriptional regulator YiaG
LVAEGMMADLEQLTGLLKDFETLLGSPTSTGTGEVINKTMQLLELKPSQLASALEVSAASVSRWTTGISSPHSRHLRAMQEMVRLRRLQFCEPDSFEFHGRKVAISSIDTFFRRAREAKSVYVFKSMLGFQAGMYPAIKQQLRDLFTFNNRLRICYGFPQDSEAAMTFLNFRRELGGEWPRNILWKELSVDHEVMQLLGSIFASPFIIEYQDGRVDILLEVPAKVVRTLDDDFAIASHASLFIELSDTHKHQMWLQWRRALEKIEWESTPIKIRMLRTCTPPIIEVREAAYEWGSSGVDPFDSCSFYVVGEIEGRIVGSIRLTDSGKASPLRAWARGSLSLPQGKGVVELTRGAVHPGKRNLGIYKSMMLRAVREAARSGFLRAVAAVEAQDDYFLKSVKNYLHQIGFENVGKVVPFDDTPCKGTLLQPMVCNLQEMDARWDVIDKELKEQSKQKNVVIVDGR